MHGKFVISLDFEIYWGVRDKKSIKEYSEELIGVREVIPRLLLLFKKYEIEATFATVGLLFFDEKKEMLKALPSVKPTYRNKNLSPYHDLENVVGEDENLDPYHFARSLIVEIKKNDQEIGSHTFSHYYCLEKGQSAHQFKADIEAAVRVAKENGIKLNSMVFPRNQDNPAYRHIILDAGFTSFRGNQRHFMYNYKLDKYLFPLQRVLRIIDSFINLSGYNIYAPEIKDGLLNIPASRLLRPYSSGLKFLETWRLRRIKSSMTAAAKTRKTFHLWWHPHNFGRNQDQNFAFLEKILQHFTELREQYGFESISMGKLAQQILREHAIK